MTANPQSLFQLAVSDTAVLELRRTAFQRYHGVDIGTTAEDTLTEEEVNSASLIALLLTQVNGDAMMSNQAVQVEYLKTDQRLLVPRALAMPYVETNLKHCDRHDLLHERYLKSTTIPYAVMRKFVTDGSSFATIRKAVDESDLPAAPPATPKIDWRRNNWCTLPREGQDDEASITLTFSYFSQAIQANCDVRDFYILNNSDMTVSDDEWKNAHRTTEVRMLNKLKPYTLQSIAALNYDACGKYALAAWVRAYGVGIGLIPSLRSRVLNEISFVTSIAKADVRNLVATFEKTHQVDILQISCNLLAMFGLFHLNKDHTFKSGDTNLERIGQSYLNTLRTIVPPNLMTEMSQNREVLVRTAAHPFGLAQTYWLARAMFPKQYLTRPLEIRHNVCPPTVQRVFIVQAAKNEWSALPGGVLLNDVYAEAVIEIDRAVDIIRKSPPSYSALHRLYGVETMLTLRSRVQKCIDIMMPCVHGYAMSQHCDDAQRKDGLGHALSLQNVARDQKSLVETWKKLWDQYVDDIDNNSLTDFAMKTLHTYEEAGKVGERVKAILGPDEEEDQEEELEVEREEVNEPQSSLPTSGPGGTSTDKDKKDE